MHSSMTHLGFIAPMALAIVGCQSNPTVEARQAEVMAAPGATEAARETTTGAQPSQGEGSSSAPGMMAHCPMNVPGTEVTTIETKRGIAVTFTTTGDVADLRRRVASMASMHNEHQVMMRRMMGDERMGSGRMDQGDDGSPHEHGGSSTGAPHGEGMGMMMTMAAATATSEEVEGGARLIFEAEDPQEVASLREQVRTHAEEMRSGKCPAMSRSDKR